MNRDQVSILEPNGVRRTRPIPSQGLTIGRGPENDLVLAYEPVSRNHAQIRFERGYYYVVDLNSANGTFLANVRLPSNTPTVWEPNQPLRIGSVLINLEPAQPQRRQRADLDAMETQVGWLPEEAQQHSDKKPNRMMLLIIGLMLAFWCLCAGLAVTAYYFLLP
ncbi:MAG: FHA domain-containing protein [Chloroflexi bacterium]|nr:FHA domain-containing protein [Chloroflexota bacterium]